METRLDVSRQRFVRETAARFFLRFHMSLIFPASGAGGSGFSLGLADPWLVWLARLVFVACLGGAALWVVWQAPVILPEAAFEALLAAGLVKAARRAQTGGWARGVLRSTALPFALMLGASVGLGWAVQHACPAATRLLDLLTHCP